MEKTINELQAAIRENTRALRGANGDLGVIATAILLKDQVDVLSKKVALHCTTQDSWRQSIEARIAIMEANIKLLSKDFEMCKIVHDVKEQGYTVIEKVKDERTVKKQQVWDTVKSILIPIILALLTTWLTSTLLP